MASLAEHRAYLEGEWRLLLVAPLSARKARLVASLIDAFADRLFSAQTDEDDILVYRAGCAEGSPHLALVMNFCSGRDGLHLAAEAQPVPLDDYPTLSVEDFMVSLYNNRTVQRLFIVAGDGERWPAMETFERAIAALDARLT